ncbi:BspA family leucine-rich repeat surface protein [Chryseobacterium sp.]|uniref:BspA family leucine-rich repeat surface protein n=1 Tax=Chryseobacterium sp. TaxID=1871047 RepID=UPI0025B7BC28|nr:BspA family leucine-rich repeat surface protein [Chryseobacterium sp.]
MLKKLLPFITFAFISPVTKAQNEFTTIWKPNTNVSAPVTVNAPYAAGTNHIWFPGIGTNYTISWEEVNYPQHNATLSNISSANQFLIDFGTPLNPNPADATYIVKVSNGNGTFNQIRFGIPTVDPITNLITWQMYGSADKITEISQWGNIQWNSMNSAFANCKILDITASDTPNLSVVTDASFMLYNTHSLSGGPAFGNWNTSNIKDFSYMLSNYSLVASDTFNAPIGTWNTSSAESFSHMLEERRLFNQPLNDWDTSHVTNMGWMFANCMAFNQPLNSWNTSQVTNMEYMFHFITNFNQPLNNWDISNVTNISHMFHAVLSFNQPLDAWNTSSVTNMSTVFSNAHSFNQSLGTWNLPSLTNASLALLDSGIDCSNYSNTLKGWADNPNTANNINLGHVTPLTYSTDVTDKRNILTNNKGWTIFNDTVGECNILGVSESHLAGTAPSIYPNPAEETIYIRNISNAKNYIILDASGRVITKDIISENSINIQPLIRGNYVLQIVSKDKIHSFKFIKR